MRAQASDLTVAQKVPMEGEIKEIATAKSRTCRDILASLPEWFGILEAIEMYACDVERMPMFAYVLKDDIVGFIAIKMHFTHAAEAYVLAVKRDFHRKGIGRMLFDHVISVLRKQGVKYLTVKTIAEQRTNRAYAETRKFYEAIGFVPLEVFPTLWDAENPCLVMIKDL
jgi:ribosomal protein S18 acetylase RimI-like enzyme